MIGRSKKFLREKLKERFGANPLELDEIYRVNNRMDLIRIYHEEIGSQATQDYANLDEITWNDLEMEKVFQRINNTKSYIGEQVLYHRLHQLDVNGRRDVEKNRRTT